MRLDRDPGQDIAGRRAGGDDLGAGPGLDFAGGAAAVADQEGGSVAVSRSVDVFCRLGGRRPDRGSLDRRGGRLRLVFVATAGFCCADHLVVRQCALLGALLFP